MSYNYSNCFPESWIGKEPVKVSDGAYYIGNDCTKQVIINNYGKCVYATWLSNGVLRVDTDNNVKLFFVGSQRFFIAYGDETEPHDKNGYEKAVRECQRLREEEKEQNNPRKEEKEVDNDNDRTEMASIASDKDDSSCTKFIFTIIPVLPVWWLIKLGIKSSGALLQLLWWIIKLPFFILSWPVRILLSCCLSKEQRRFAPEMPEMKVFPHYSFKIF